MDRFLENKVSYRIYQDTQIFIGRKNGMPNLSLQPFTGPSADQGYTAI